MNAFSAGLTRRQVIQGAGAMTALALFARTPLAAAVKAAVEDLGVETWCACVVNCAQRCPVRCFTKNGRVIRIETDCSQPDSGATRQIRACQRGRSMRERIYNNDRLLWPMKRIGERGEGKFERISWDEAIATIAKNWKAIIAKYGNEAVYWQYASAQQSFVSSRRAWWRLMNLTGGYLKYYGSYSSAQYGAAFPYTYGPHGGSWVSEIANSDLCVLFGNNPSVTRPSGGGIGYQFDLALKAGKTKLIVIDPCFTDTASTRAAQWIPIRPGTDAALVAALGYEFIRTGKTDEAFLAKYCVGFDEKTLPASAPAHSDYKSYLMGTGYDKVKKTPEWAAGITGIPADTIRKLAADMAAAKTLWVSQGFGPQRRANGEDICRAIAMVPIMLGQLGKPGTNTGANEGGRGLPAVYLPIGTNPVKATIPCFLWTDAIVRGTEMTRVKDGLKGVEKLSQNIRMIINSGGNTLINQHSDTNRTDRILKDTKKCEFIVVCDNMMTPSARYADILLPDTLGPETDDIVCQGWGNGDTGSLIAVQQAVKPSHEQLPSWEICRRLAAAMGVEDKYTEGKDQKAWVQWCYEETAKKFPGLPDFATFWKQGLVKVYATEGKSVALADFRADPEKHPLKTPSGKIEIYSEALMKATADWQLPEGDSITPVPVYWRSFDMPGDKVDKKYPLQCFGFHGHGRIHSTFHNLPGLRALHPDAVYINTVDAKARGIADGDKVTVFNDRGTVVLPARVTPRIMPGVITIPQGAWYKPAVAGERTVDAGGCINTLTGQHPSPLAKGNSQHNILVQVAKAAA